MNNKFITMEQVAELRDEVEVRLLITGPRNSGKSRFGFELAQSWGGYFISGNPHAQISALTETVGEELALGLETVAESREELTGWVSSVAEAFGLTNILDQHPLRLSGGQTQMTVLACYSTLHSPVVVFDEPLAHLDSDATTRLFQTSFEFTGKFAWISTRPVIGEVEMATHILDLSQEKTAWEPQVWNVIDRHELQLQLRPRVLKLRDVALNPAAIQPRWWELWRTRQQRPPVASGLNVDVRPGSVYALVGPNGSGKTTLLRTAAGLIPAQEGTITVEGIPVGELSPEQRNRYVSMAAQNPGHHFLASTVAGELAIGAARDCSPALKKHLLGAVGLWGREQVHPQDLSLVEQHLLVLVTAIAARPSVLLLDEPTARVDQVGLTQVVQLLKEFTHAGGAVLVATHDQEFLGRIDHQLLDFAYPQLWPRQ
ncbi:ATP-binding cassette domain-containing protein [Rothia sp. LK2588]|uniref:ABC transporter ATP-binding protein n=1 Tax=Rothia sp. LK2588 TaxID=3114369 RepID=UPI0034CE4EAC